MPRLRRLVELRLIDDGQTPEALSALTHPERRALADEARAVGDEELARDLEEGLAPPKHGYR